MLFFSQLKAQFNFEYSDSIVVKIGADTSKLAWSGGLNYVQFSDFDFDFERQANPKGDRVQFVMSGKFLPYKYYGAEQGVPEYGFKES